MVGGKTRRILVAVECLVSFYPCFGAPVGWACHGRWLVARAHVHRYRRLGSDEGIKGWLEESKMPCQGT